MALPGADLHVLPTIVRTMQLALEMIFRICVRTWARVWLCVSGEVWGRRVRAAGSKRTALGRAQCARASWTDERELSTGYRESCDGLDYTYKTRT